MTDIRSAANRFPEATLADPHIVIDKREWVPGQHPEPHRREQGQQGSMETYVRCLRCGAEALRENDLPPNCSAD